jgi:hypothetical protein
LTPKRILLALESRLAAAIELDGKVRITGDIRIHKAVSRTATATRCHLPVVALYGKTLFRGHIPYGIK